MTTLYDVFENIFESNAVEMAELQKEAAAQESFEALEKLATAAAYDLVAEEIMEKQATSELGEIMALGMYNGFMKAAAKETGALANDGGAMSGNPAGSTGYAGIIAKDRSNLQPAKSGLNADYMNLLKKKQLPKATPGTFSTSGRMNAAMNTPQNVMMTIPAAPKAM